MYTHLDPERIKRLPNSQLIDTIQVVPHKWVHLRYTFVDGTVWVYIWEGEPFAPTSLLDYLS